MAMMRWRNTFEGWDDDHYVGLEFKTVITFTSDAKEKASHTNKIIDYRRAVITVLPSQPSP
jgi:hypothetical protein